MKKTVNMIPVAVLFWSAAMCLTSTVAAERRPTADPGVNVRQQEQQRRIRQGVRSGNLTPEEAKGLRQEEQSVRQEERQLKADGTLTPGERAKLQTDLNKTSKDIHQEKHDAEVRPRLTRDQLVNTRQRRQQERIAGGIRSGELTKGEATRLEGEQKAIRTEERAYKADGKLTPAERKDLQTDLNKTSKDIYKQKHDAQTRPGTTPPIPPQR